MKKMLTFSLLLLGGLITGASGYVNLSAETLHEWIERGDTLVILDVREQNEYDVRHIKGAVLYPWNSGALIQRYNELPIQTLIAVYCKAGSRSAQASAFLDTVDSGRYSGYIYNLIGGISSWPYETVTGEPEQPSISLDADSLSFGEIYLDSTAEKIFTIYNKGLAEITISSISPGGGTGVFSVVPGSAAVASGDSVKVAVSFTPSAGVAYIDSIVIVSNAEGANTLSLIVSGSGITALAGDVDSSGKVDIFDLLELLRGLGSGAAANKADVNSDGAVNIFDLIELLKILSGK